MSGLQPKEPRAFLTAARVKPHVYLLGCNHRQITFYSQQTRAVNLVHSLLQTAELREGQPIAVVGAGVAGLTAAGFAAENGYSVGLYEKEEEPLTIQAACENRWVHPHIYDWPEPGSLNDATGDLPVLNWTAGSAQNVIRQLRKEWRSLEQKHSRRISFYPRSLVGSDDSQHAGTLLSELTRQYQVVILAVGFGKEPERFGTKPYWVDDNIQTRHRADWLVSGFGDGALADLMQICIPDFKHEELKNFVAPVTLDGELAKHLLEQEDAGRRDQEALNSYYEKELRVPQVLELLRDRVNTTRRIVIQGKAGSHLYGSTSAIINRFVISQIQRLYEAAHNEKSRDFFQVIHAEWVGQPETKSGTAFQVTFNDRSPFEGGLVVRHGPEPVLKEYFPDLWEVTERDRENLRDLPQQLDPSRLPILHAGSLWEVEQRTHRQGEWWCLVLTKEGPLERVMRWAVPKLKEHLKGFYPLAFGHADTVGHKHADALKRAIQPTFVSVSEAVRDAAAYRTTVRALCCADVVLADVTEFDPAMMLFLGVRAAVRRGVTIVSSAKRPALHDYNKEIPFNLREISILDHSGIATDTMAEDFSNMIQKGIKNYLDSANYEDLPAYTYVRLPNINWSNNDVLVLCPFSESYQETFESLKGELKLITGQQLDCRRVIDDISPRLNSQRLFGAIRHADNCLVDWTDWRHNVFFELGVRLAVHPKGAICLLDHKNSSEPLNAACKETARLLKTLFNPKPHDDISAAWHEYKDGPDFSLGRGETYRIVSNAVEPETSFFTPVHNLLLSSVTNIIRYNPGNVDIDQLYAMANDAVPIQYQQAARERLLAALFYLENRFKPDQLTEEDLQRDDQAKIATEYIQVCNELVQYLKTDEFKDLRVTINNKQRELKKRLEGLKK